ncbi:LacI family DNA-binding transcriptional regulator [Bifidobacterium choloepi]|uniref:LacI family transcriptional regulator n=1 Tax=Bifidobacterium choloepi TaxID=2614131 RepID=A0A6I5NBF6_9BIFI|nr:LacI family DNA-binding transcriptional regulator [Bifidobacterium choloepi]NEG69820.1 LacI family transcriptional regulator [Bifidobacterium choloepi]
MVRQANAPSRASTSPSSSSAHSITDVAALASVSIATVSRVLSGKRQKDDDIARRVRQAAEQLNYSVNVAASSLRGAGTRTVGLVIPSATDEFAAQLLDALESAADDRDSQVLLGVGGTKALQTARVESLISRNVDGLIVLPATGADLTPILERHAGRIPIVQIGNGRRSRNYSQVSLDELLAMEQIVDHLASLGAKTVAYMAGRKVSFESAEQFSMLHTQLRSFGLETKAAWNQFGDQTVQRGYDCAMRIFAQDKPDAVICCDDKVALGVIVALHSLGLRAPEDVMLVGQNNAPLCETASPSITTLRPPFEQIAEESLRLIAQGPNYPSEVSLTSQLIVRESTVGTATTRQITAR